LEEPHGLAEFDFRRADERPGLICLAQMAGDGIATDTQDRGDAPDRPGASVLEAGMQRTTVARRLSVLRGTYKQLAAKGLVTWEPGSR
jgi:hypothetical protein